MQRSLQANRVRGRAYGQSLRAGMRGMEGEQLWLRVTHIEHIQLDIVRVELRLRLLEQSAHLKAAIHQT